MPNTAAPQRAYSAHPAAPRATPYRPPALAIIAILALATSAFASTAVAATAHSSETILFTDIEDRIERIIDPKNTAFLDSLLRDIDTLVRRSSELTASVEKGEELDQSLLLELSNTHTSSEKDLNRSSSALAQSAKRLGDASNILREVEQGTIQIVDADRQPAPESERRRLGEQLERIRDRHAAEQRFAEALGVDLATVQRALFALGG